MANIENITVGLAANDKKGDPLRDAMQKANRNFSALNTAIQGVLDGKGQASGYASLGTDGRLLAAQAPIVYAPTLPTTTHDLNTYVTPGTFYQAAVAGATTPTGVNYPVAQVGFLEVVATGTPVLQVYTTRAAISQQYWRVRISSSSWSAWAEVLRGSLLASAGGVATLGADSRLLPAQAPIVFTTSLNAVDANSIVTPGVYSNNADASATAALNWPEQLAGTLTVETSNASNAQVTQTYTTRNGSSGVTRTYKRVRFGGSGGIWGTWQQQARFDDAMTHVYLGAAGVDCNSLVADNTYYTIDQAGAVVSGSNWPPTTSIIGGGVEVRRQAASRIFQTVTLLVGSNQKPRIFFRYGDPTSGNWQNWTMISSLSNVGWLPTANCGDVYVDGVGWHRWNGTTYEMSALAPWLPTAAHDLNNYTTPGEYCQSSTAGAAAGANYPVSIGGFLKVSQGAGINGTVQEYTVRSAGGLAASSGPRRFWRVRDGSSWSPWQEVLSAGLGMIHTFLTAATDANTLTADNTFYTWTASAVASGANFPGYSAAGYMQVFWQAATVVSQELTLLVTGGKPLKFARFGNTSTGVWQPWKVMGAFNSTGWMPANDMGDIYVDGLGWHAWNASRSAYLRLPSTPTHRQGLKTAINGTTAITVQPGVCASALGETTLNLTAASTRTIQTSGAFVHGATGNGLLTGARTANTWYYIFLLRRNSDGDCCVAFDTTFNCANRPSTHSYYRRIGCVSSGPANILWPYVQFGNEFWFATKVNMYVGATFSADTAYTPNLPTPPNVAHIARLTGFLGTLNGNNAALMNRWYDSTGGFSEWSYVLIASPIMNSVNDWEVPVAPVATPVTGFQSPSVACTGSVFVKGYTDLFED
jgi:hypothetical protein